MVEHQALQRQLFPQGFDGGCAQAGASQQGGAIADAEQGLPAMFGGAKVFGGGAQAELARLAGEERAAQAFVGELRIVLKRRQPGAADQRRR